MRMKWSELICSPTFYSFTVFFVLYHIIILCIVLIKKYLYYYLGYFDLYCLELFQILNLFFSIFFELRVMIFKIDIGLCVISMEYIILSRMS